MINYDYMFITKSFNILSYLFKLLSTLSKLLIHKYFIYRLVYNLKLYCLFIQNNTLYKTWTPNHRSLQFLKGV